METQLKLERRKSATLERESDQMKFSVKTSEMELAETSESLKGQIERLKSENSNLIQKLEINLRENQKKLEEERAEHMKTKSR